MRRIAALTAALALFAAQGALAQSQPQSKATTMPDTGQAAPGAAPGAVAYPDNPAGTPAADDKGAPVVTDRAACPTAGNGRCPDKPAPSGAASEPAPAKSP